MKDKMKLKFVRWEQNSLFDQDRVYGFYYGKDNFGNHKIKIIRQFSKTFANIPKRNIFRGILGLLPFTHTHEVIWYDDSGGELDFKLKTGNIEIFPSQELNSDWRINFDIREVPEDEPDVLKKTIDHLRKRGAWFGFPA